MVAANECKKGMYDCVVYNDHVTCTCPCYKFDPLCKHSICVAEITGILKNHLEFLKRSPKRTNKSRSGLIQPTKEGQGKKGGSHRNPWRPARCQEPRVKEVQIPQHPFTEIHHNNKPFFVCFPAKECRQCLIEFPCKQMIMPFNIVLSHEKKWLSPHPDNPRQKLPSTKHNEVLLRQANLHHEPFSIFRS